MSEFEKPMMDTPACAIINVYLHDEIVNILQHFGTLDDVANKIVDLAIAGIFDMETLDKCPPSGNAKKYAINIINSEYLEYREMRGARSSKLSLRRLLYYFVDNELYADLGWQIIKGCTIKDTRITKFNNLLAKILTDLTKLKKTTNNENVTCILNAMKELRKIK